MENIKLWNNKNQKRNYLVPDLKYKIKRSKKKIGFGVNLNHYRDFISMEDISKIIFVLLRKKFNGVLNLGSGRSIFLKDIGRPLRLNTKKEVILI